jgi:hypothetical protein
MTDLAVVENDILNINEWTTTDDLGTLRSQLAFFATKLKEMRALLDEKMIEIIKETGQDITIGPIRYYAGIEKKTKCIEHMATLTALFEAAGGDIAVVAGCIASDGLKPGACKSILGEVEFPKHFDTIEVNVVKEGKPSKKLMSTNDEFTKGRS